MKTMSILFNATSFILFLVFSGCAAPKGAMYLSPDESGPAGYHRADRSGVFENSHIRLSARQVDPGEFDEGPAILNELFKGGYIVLRMEIDNRSGSKVIYSPSRTVFTDDAMDYRKPLDYTDLYDLAKEGGDGKVSVMKGRFYDLDVTILPGAKTSKLIIFRPPSKNITKAELAIKDIYIGTEVFNISLPFSIRYREQ